MAPASSCYIVKHGAPSTGGSLIFDFTGLTGYKRCGDGERVAARLEASQLDKFSPCVSGTVQRIRPRLRPPDGDRWKGIRERYTRPIKSECYDNGGGGRDRWCSYPPREIGCFVELSPSRFLYISVYRRIVGVIDRVGGRDDWEGGFCGGRSKNGGSWSVGWWSEGYVYPRMRRMVYIRVFVGMVRKGRVASSGFEFIVYCSIVFELHLSTLIRRNLKMFFKCKKFEYDE